MAAHNILWLTIDSLRYDHTSLAGYHRETTPNLERIASGSAGRSRSNCFSHAIWTQPSSGSLLTGTYPMYHGLGFDNDVLPAELDTVPELLADAGYRTACISELTNVGPATGLDRGFEDYHSLIDESKLGLTRRYPRALAEYLGQCLRSPRATLTTIGEDRSNFLRGGMPLYTREIAGDHFTDADDRPLFLYAHYLGPHVPYYPPPRYLREYLDGVDMSAREALRFSSELFSDLSNIREAIAGGCDFTDDEWAALTALYDAEIRHTDARIGELVDRARRELDEVTVVITADHGDLLGEHDLITHRIVLDDALVNVPLVTHGFPAGLDGDHEIVQHVDVMETLLDAAGADTDQFQGVNLASGTREYALFQRSEYDFSNYDRFDPTIDFNRFHELRVHGVRDAEHKYVRSENRAELFVMPDERTDVAAEKPDITEQFDAWLSEQVRQHDGRLQAGDRQDLTDAMQRQLADLGYVERDG